MSNKKIILAAIFISATALFLRLYNLDLLPVFADEAIYVRWSQIMANESTLRFLPLSDGKQPLFMWILMLLIRKFNDPLVIGRLISSASGVVTTISIALLSYNLFKSKTAALASALIWAISPFAVFFDRLALVDSLLTLLGVVTFHFGVLAARSKRLDYAMLAGFALGFAVLTKSPALFFALMYPATWLFANWKALGRKRLFMELGGLTLVTFTIAFGMYNILRLGPNFHLLALRNYDYVYPYSHLLTSPLDPFKGHMGGIWSYFLLLAPLGAMLLATVGIAANFRKNGAGVAALLAWGLLPILLIAEYSKVVTARYVLFAMPYFAILAGSAALASNSLLKKVSYVFLAIFVAQSLYFGANLLTNPEAATLPYGDRAGYLEEWTAGQGIKEVSEFIKEEAGKLPTGKKIVVGTEGYFGTLPDGLQMYLEGIANVTTIGVGLGLQELPASLAESRSAGNKTYLVINKSRLSVPPEKLNLKLIAEYPKALRRVGSREYELYGPREVLYFFEVK